MSQSTCEVGCAAGSIERDAGAGKFCALPCVLSNLPDSVVPVSFQVPAGESTQIKCLDDFRPVWNPNGAVEAVTFECEANNVQHEVDVSQLMLDLPKCAKPCNAGLTSIGRADVWHPMLQRGQSWIGDCPVNHDYYEPQEKAVRLYCNLKSGIEVSSNECKVRACAPGQVSLSGGKVRHGEIDVKAAISLPCPKTDAYSGDTVELYCNNDRKVTVTERCEADHGHWDCELVEHGNNWPVAGNCRRRRNQGSKCHAQFSRVVNVERGYDKSLHGTLSKPEIFKLFRHDFEQDCRKQAENFMIAKGKIKELHILSTDLSTKELHEDIHILADKHNKVKFRASIPCFPICEFCN